MSGRKRQRFDTVEVKPNPAATISGMIDKGPVEMADAMLMFLLAERNEIDRKITFLQAKIQKRQQSESQTKEKESQTNEKESQTNEKESQTKEKNDTTSSVDTHTHTKRPEVFETHHKGKCPPPLGCKVDHNYGEDV